MPGTLEAYYQEAGRGGRDRKPATAILLHAFPDRFMHEFFINGALPARETVTAVYGVVSNPTDEDVTIVSAFTPVTDRVERHETIENDDGTNTSAFDAPSRCMVRAVSLRDGCQFVVPQ